LDARRREGAEAKLKADEMRVVDTMK